jgi:hypothetical protein
MATAIDNPSRPAKSEATDMVAEIRRRGRKGKNK